MTTTLKSEFDEYCNMVYPTGPLSVRQRIDVKRAFMAGAMSLFSILIKNPSTSQMSALEKEIVDYALEVKNLRQ
jgi:hypothetical protein